MNNRTKKSFSMEYKIMKEVFEHDRKNERENKRIKETGFCFVPGI